MSQLQTFGCKAYTYINKQEGGKLDDKSQLRIFVEYDNRSKIYHIYTEGKNVTISMCLLNKIINNFLDICGKLDF